MGTVAGAGTRTGVEIRRRVQNGNGDGTGNGSESGSEDRNGNGNGDGERNEGGIGKGGGEAKKRKKPHKSCKRYLGNGGTLSGERKKRRQESVGSVAAFPDNLENSKEAGREEHATQGQRVDNYSSRESVSALKRRIKRFRNKYYYPLPERTNASSMEQLA